MATVKLCALSAFSLGGGVDVEAGDIFELEKDNAAVKCHLGWAREATEKDIAAAKAKGGGKPATTAAAKPAVVRGGGKGKK